MNAKFSHTGALAGGLIGSQIFLAFTLIAEPGKWLFVDWSAGRAVAAYGYGALIFIFACGLVGSAVVPLYRILRVRRKHRKSV